MRPAEELLYDSEASLRLVDHAIEELRSPEPSTDGDDILGALSRASDLVEELIAAQQHAGRTAFSSGRAQDGPTE